jgi:hypothetical protein
MASVYGSVYGVESSGGGVVPDAGDVRFGTAVGSGTGTLSVPSAANVLSGTPVDATVGTYVVTSAGNVRSGTAFGAASAQTGTAVIPSLANTKIGVAGDGGTGIYDGSDRWSDPLASNVRLGVTYRANATANNRTGTLNVEGGSSAGPGADPYVATILEEGAVPVENADVWVTNDAEGLDVVAGTLQTDANGQVTFLLDAGSTYYLWCQGGGANAIQGEMFTA